MTQTRKRLEKGYHVMKNARPVEQMRINKYIEHLNKLGIRGGKKKRRGTKKKRRGRRKTRRTNYKKKIAKWTQSARNHWGADKGSSRGCFRICASSSMK